MAVDVLPGHFAFGRAAPDGSAWELFGEVYPENPRFALGEGDFEMLRLWRLYQAGTALPERGGVMDQAAAMLDAFAIMSAAEAQLPKVRP